MLNSTNEVFDELSHYDVYLLTRMVAKSRLRPAGRWVGQTSLSYHFGSNFRLDWWCEYVAGCRQEELQFTIIFIYLKYIFISWLPDLPDRAGKRCINAVPC